jgi:hypothetical protein
MWWIVILVGIGLVAAMVVALVRRGNTGTIRRGDPDYRRMDHSGSDPDTAPGGGFGGGGLGGV